MAHCPAVPDTGQRERDGMVLQYFLEKCFVMRTMGCTLARMKPMQGPTPHRPHCRNKRREIPATRSTIGHLSKQGRSYPPLSTLPENKNDNEDNPANGCPHCLKNNLPSSEPSNERGEDCLTTTRPGSLFLQQFVQIRIESRVFAHYGLHQTALRVDYKLGREAAYAIHFQ